MSPGARAFCELLDRLDVRAGDVIYLHTSFSRLTYLELGPQEMLEALLARLGAYGTLAVPSFAWSLDRLGTQPGYADYLRQRPVFDMRQTPANVGLVPETFRGMRGV